MSIPTGDEGKVLFRGDIFGLENGRPVGKYHGLGVVKGLFYAFLGLFTSKPTAGVSTDWILYECEDMRAFLLDNALVRDDDVEQIPRKSLDKMVAAVRQELSHSDAPQDPKKLKVEVQKKINTILEKTGLRIAPTPASTDNRDWQAQFIKASTTGDLIAVQAILKHGRDKLNDTTLKQALTDTIHDEVRQEILKGIDTNTAHYLFIEASISGNLQVVGAILNHGRDKLDDTVLKQVLIKAIQEERDEVIGKVIKKACEDGKAQFILDIVMEAGDINADVLDKITRAFWEGGGGDLKQQIEGRKGLSTTIDKKRSPPPPPTDKDMLAKHGLSDRTEVGVWREKFIEAAKLGYLLAVQAMLKYGHDKLDTTTMNLAVINARREGHDKVALAILEQIGDTTAKKLVKEVSGEEVVEQVAVLYQERPEDVVNKIFESEKQTSGQEYETLSQEVSKLFEGAKDILVKIGSVERHEKGETISETVSKICDTVSEVSEKNTLAVEGIFSRSEDHVWQEKFIEASRSGKRELIQLILKYGRDKLDDTTVKEALIEAIKGQHDEVRREIFLGIDSDTASRVFIEAIEDQNIEVPTSIFWYFRSHLSEEALKQTAVPHIAYGVLKSALDSGKDAQKGISIFSLKYIDDTFDDEMGEAIEQACKDGKAQFILDIVMGAHEDIKPKVLEKISKAVETGGAKDVAQQISRLLPEVPPPSDLPPPPPPMSVAQLLGAGADPNSKDEDGWTLLHKAVRDGDVSAVNLLLENGADPTVESDEGQTPISMAIELGKTEVFEALIPKCELDILKDKIQDALNPSTEIREIFFKHAFQKSFNVSFDELENPGMKNTNAETPFLFAVQWGTQEHIKKIVDLKLPDQQEYTAALHRAVQRGDFGIVGDLVTGGGDPNSKDENENTPLDVAVMDRNMEILEVLISHCSLDTMKGAIRPNSWVPDNAMSEICFKHAFKKSFGRDFDPNIDPAALNENNETAFSFTVQWGTPQNIKQLLDQQKDDTAPRLCREVLDGDLEAVKRALQDQPDLNVKDKNGRTPVEIAIILRKYELVDILFKFGRYTTETVQWAIAWLVESRMAVHELKGMPVFRQASLETAEPSPLPPRELDEVETEKQSFLQNQEWGHLHKLYRDCQEAWANYKNDNRAFDTLFQKYGENVDGGHKKMLLLLHPEKNPNIPFVQMLFKWIGNIKQEEGWPLYIDTNPKEWSYQLMSSPIPPKTEPQSSI